MPLNINTSPNSKYIVGGNNADVVYFSLSLVGNDIVLFGNETYTWNFGEVGQPILTGSGPHTIFYRNPSGPAGYNVSVVVHQILDNNQALSGTNGTAGQTDFYYTANTTVNVYVFDSEIAGPDYVLYNSNVPEHFFISSGTFDDSTVFPQSVIWEMDGLPVIGAASTSGNVYDLYLNSPDYFTEIREYVLVAKITHGDQTKTLTKRINVTLGNQIFGTRNLNDVSPNLLFFNKQGDNLNFEYTEYSPGKFRWQGDMIFDENSNDTFKTIGLYVFEEVAPILYSNQALTLNKFQFFNENGIDFLAQPGSTVPNQSSYSTLVAPQTLANNLDIDDIQPVITKPGFMSKWVYGNNFDTLFPKGTDVWFENVRILDSSNNLVNIPDFNPTVAINFGNPTYHETQRRRLWTVVDSKQNAIMVITDTANAYWSDNYHYDNTKKGKIFSANFIRFWYPLNNADFSNWNESIGTIEGSLFSGRKVTVVNSNKNSAVYTAHFNNDNSDLNKQLRRFLRIDTLTMENLPAGYGFQIVLNFKTNRVFVSSGPVNFIPSAGNSFPFQNQKNIMIFESFGTQDTTPILLQPGTVFVTDDDGSSVNLTKEYTVVARGAAMDILNINESDRKGYNLTCLNVNNIISDPPTFRIINVDSKTGSQQFDVVLTNNTTFIALINLLNANQPINFSLASMANLIQQEINKQAKGVVTSWNPGDTFLNVNESAGWKLDSITVITKKTNPTVTSAKVDPYHGGLPTQAIIGSQTVPISENTIGYIYDRTAFGTIHIQIGFDTTLNKATWFTISETKTILWVDYVTTSPAIVFAQDLNTTIHLRDTFITFEQVWQNSTLLSLIYYAGTPLPPSLQSLVVEEQSKMFQRFVTAWQSTFDFYGLDLYQTDNGLAVGRKWTSYDDPNTFDIFTLAPIYDANNDYIDVTFNGIRFDSGTAGDVLNAQHLTTLPTVEDIRVSYNLQVLENLTNEYNQSWGLREKPTTEQYRRKIIIEHIDPATGLTLIINGIDYTVGFDEIVTNLNPTNTNLVDIEQTLKNFGLVRFGLDQAAISPNEDQDIGLKYYEQLESIGIIVTLEKSGEHGGFSYAGTAGYIPYDTIVLTSKYPNVAIDFQVLGTDNEHKILHSDVAFYVIQNTLTITVNGVRYTTTGTNIFTILQNWLTVNAPILLVDHIIVEYLDPNTLRFSTLATNTELNYQVYVGRNAAVGETLYTITDHRPGNTNIIVASNEIVDVTGGFESNNFATGMLMNITGSKWPLNNQRYNIIYLNQVEMVMSYQGPFWNENDVFGNLNNRWQTLYNFNWESFADQNVKFTFNVITIITLTGTTAQVQFFDQSTVANIVRWIWDFGDGNTYTGTIVDQQNYFDAIASGTAGTNIQNPAQPNHTYAKTGKYVVALTLLDNAGNLHTNSEMVNIKDEFASTSGIDFGNYLSITTHKFIRFPREGYNDTANISFRWRWLEPDLTEIFYYDFSGTQLQPAGIFTYVGPVPLITDPALGTKVFLNTEANKDLDFISDPAHQQTVFPELNFNLEKIDSETDISFQPVPMQVFVGYRSDFEGVNTRTIILEKVEDLVVTIKTQKIDPSNVQTDLTVNYYKNVVTISSDINEFRVERFDSNFIDLGLKPGQQLLINGVDNTNQYGQAPFLNNGKIIEIAAVGTNWIQFVANSSIQNESSWKQVQNYRSPYNLISTGFTITLTIQPIEIGRIQLNGQTTVEDDRYRIITYNKGLNIKPTDAYIFKEYDVEEHGIDWMYLNAKRKELLANYPEIYNFIGSYKAVINSINYFGYNDLAFNEYYRNVDPNSKLYGHLVKVEIPDIFNNLVEGFKPNDFILGTLPNNKFIKTNLFNLTYQITDYQGNSVLAYSLDEVIIKLLGLKGWLQNEVIPIGKRILDITGVTQNNPEINLHHDIKQVFNLTYDATMTPVNFKTEAYLQPIINNSQTYNVHIEFNTLDNSVPDYFQLKIQTFATEDDFRQEPFSMKAVQIINEYRTDMSSYNFTADINVDPFIMIDVITDNGYGEIFNKRRTYSLQSLAFLN